MIIRSDLSKHTVHKHGDELIGRSIGEHVELGEITRIRTGCCDFTLQVDAPLCSEQLWVMQKSASIEFC